MRIVQIVALFLIGIAFQAQSQVIISSVQDGAWNNAATWGGTIPTSANSDSILIAHQVFVPAAFSVTIDGTRVLPGATLTINTGGTIILPAVVDALKVNGTLIGRNSSTITGPNGTNISFTNTATYRHEFASQQGVIPLSNWHANSNLVLAGYTTFATATVAGNWGQSFGNVTFTCASQTVNLSLSGLLTTVNGTLDVQNTGTRSLVLSTTQNPTINLNNLIVSGTGSLIFSTSGANTTVNIAGDFSYTSSNLSYTNSSGRCTLNVDGDFNMSAGSFSFAGSGADGIGTLNLMGDFNFTGGIIREDGSNSADIARGVINFIRPGTQVFTNTGTIIQTIYFNVPSGTTLDVTGESQLRGDTNSRLTLGGTLILRSVSATGAIITGSGAGGGNIRTAIRVYDPNSRIVYAGAAEQIVGNGHPSSADVTMEVQNAAGVTLNTTSTLVNLILNGDLVLTTGNLNIQSTATARGLTIGKGISGTGNIVFSGANTDLTINGSGDLGVVPFPAGTTTMRTLILNRTAGSADFNSGITVSNITTITTGQARFNSSTTLTAAVNVNGGSIDFNATSQISGAVSLAAGTNIFFEGNSLTMTSTFTSAGGTLSANSTSTLSLTGTGVFGTLVFSPTGNTIGALTINKSGGGSVATLNSALTIATTLTLSQGAFNHQSGLVMNTVVPATLTRTNNAGTITTTAPGGGPYNLSYTGSNITTGLETSGSLNNLTSSLSGVLTQVGAIVLAGQLNVASGTYTAGANTISTNSVLIGGTLNAPTTTLTTTGTGTFNINGTLTPGTGTVVFDGSTTVGGAAATKNFNHITLNATRTLNITGQTVSVLGNLTFASGATFTTTGGTIRFSGAATHTVSANGASFNNITVTKTGGTVNLTSALNLTGSLDVTTNHSVASNGNLTIVSTSDGTTGNGRIGPLAGTANVTGSVNVQRFWGIADNVDRFISTPIADAAVNELIDDFFITGDFAGSSYPCGGTCTNDGYSLKYYNEPIPGTFPHGYHGFPELVITENLIPGRGYTAYMWNGVATTLWDMAGTINRGNYPVTVTHTPSVPDPLPDEDGWNLLGNPYPSSISWNNQAGFGRNAAEVAPTIYVWDAVAKVYRSFNVDTQVGNLTNGNIAMGQSFWIYVNEGVPSSTITFNENAKTATTGAFRRDRAQDGPTLTVSLSNEFTIDDSFLLVGQGEVTTAYDAVKFVSGQEELYVAPIDARGRQMVSLAVDGEDFEIPLVVYGREDGMYQLSFATGVENRPLYLVDRERNIITPISGGKAYSFFMHGLASNRERFVLASRAPDHKENTSPVVAYPNPVESVLTIRIEAEMSDIDKVTLLDGIGKVAESVSIEQKDGYCIGTVDTSDKSAGLYFVETVIEGKRSIFKVIKN